MEIVLDARRFKGRSRFRIIMEKIWTHYMIAWVTSEKKRSS